jgi:hypothetical protein
VRRGGCRWDFFNAPSVDEVHLSGYAGRARAQDDFDVAEVSVALTDAGGTALESGAAVETPAVQQPPFRRAVGLHRDDGGAGRHRCTHRGAGDGYARRRERAGGGEDGIE